jgi:hypothetical protein
VNLHIDFARFDPLERDRIDMCDRHRPPPAPRISAGSARPCNGAHPRARR